MSTFQKLTLLILALILVGILALVVVLLTRPTVVVAPTATHTSSPAPLTTEEISATGAAVRDSWLTPSAVELTATVVKRLVDESSTQVAVSATAQQERINATATARASN